MQRRLFLSCLCLNSIFNQAYLSTSLNPLSLEFFLSLAFKADPHLVQMDLKGTMRGMVTYRYYVGRLNMFEDQYEKAEENLEYALVHCHQNAMVNKKKILNYLLPVKLLRGRLPTKKRE